MQDIIIDKKMSQLNNPEIYMVEGPSNRENGASVRMRVALFKVAPTTSAPTAATTKDAKSENENPDLLNYQNPHQAARGTFIIIVGRAEYIEKYADVIAELNRRGFDALVVDNRGQGLSDRLLPNPQAGHIDSFDDAARHVAIAYQKLHDKLSAPLYLLGHSMGGLIGLQILIKNYIPRIKAAVFTAPLWGLNPIPCANIIASAANSIGMRTKIAPLQMKNWHPEGFEGNRYTNSTSYFRRNNALQLATKELQLAGATYGWIHQTYEALKGFTPENLAKVRIPILLQLAGDEQIVDTKGINTISSMLPLVTQNTIRSAKHEILMETDNNRKIFYDNFDKFMANLNVIEK